MTSFGKICSGQLPLPRIDTKTPVCYNLYVKTAGFQYLDAARFFDSTRCAHSAQNDTEMKNDTVIKKACHPE